jgi:hypothetical protein
MSSFKEALAAARATVPDTKTVDVAVGDLLVSLKFKAVPTTAWTEITASHPPRVDVPLDMNYGYNWHAASDDAARQSVVRVEDGQDVPFEYVEASGGANGEPKVEAVDEWADFLEVLSAPDLTAIRNAVWELNEWAPGARTAALKKASTVNSKKKRN